MVKLQITSGCIELSTPFVNEIKAFLKEVHDAFAEEFKGVKILIVHASKFI